MCRLLLQKITHKHLTSAITPASKQQLQGQRPTSAIPPAKPLLLQGQRPNSAITPARKTTTTGSETIFCHYCSKKNNRYRARDEIFHYSSKEKKNSYSVRDQLLPLLQQKTHPIQDHRPTSATTPAKTNLYRVRH